MMSAGPELPPRQRYSIPVHGRLISSPMLSDVDICVAMAIRTFHEQSDRRVAPGLKRETVAEVLGLGADLVHASAERLMRFGVMIESWAFLHDVVVSDKAASSLGVSDLPRDRRRLDTRIFFCPELTAESARLWALCTLERTEGAQLARDRLGWSDDAILESARELADLGLATLHLGESMGVKSRRLPESGLRIVEFLSEELGLSGSLLARNTSPETDAKRRSEKTRRERSRRPQSD